jgi:hypothetical protein
VSTAPVSDRYTTLPDEKTLAETVVALEERGFSVEITDDLGAARDAVLARIPEGSSVMTNTSVTLTETGIADYALGSVHAVTRDGALFIASASGRQLAAYAWGAPNVIFVVGAHKLVPGPEAARERIYAHSLQLEDGRAYAAYGMNSFVGKILEIDRDTPARIHLVLIRQVVGF